MLKTILYRSLATAAILAAISGTTVLSAQEDDYPMDADDGAAATCSNGGKSVCKVFTRTVTTCTQWVPVNINASGGAGGGSASITMECSQPSTKTTETTNYWSE